MDATRNEVASTLIVEKSGSGVRRWLSLGGSPGSWEVREGGTVVATAAMPLKRFEMLIELDGRNLTLRMDGGTFWMQNPRRLAVVDDATGEHVLNGDQISGGRERNLIVERWSISAAGRRPIEFVYRLREPRTCGFFDDAGNPILVLGHDVSFTPAAGDSWRRILLRMWGGVLESADRYLVHVHDRVPEAPLLTLVGMWMERTAPGRYPDPSEQP